MNSSDYTRRQKERAEECRAFAEATSSQQARASYSKMAEAFEALSRDAEQSGGRTQSELRRIQRFRSFSS